VRVVTGRRSRAPGERAKNVSQGPCALSRGQALPPFVAAHGRADGTFGRGRADLERSFERARRGHDVGAAVADRSAASDRVGLALACARAPGRAGGGATFGALPAPARARSLL
jgi:hypothetical protein